MPIIYVTEFCPETKRVLKSARDSGFTSIDQVVELMGEPVVKGIRTATYRKLFYSEYNLTQTCGDKTYLNRET